MYGTLGTAAEVTSLATQFLPGQVEFAVQHGLNTQVYASEAIGLAFAFGNETGGSAFADAYGPIKPCDAKLNRRRFSIRDGSSNGDLRTSYNR